jgi:hypothetical protein
VYCQCVRKLDDPRLCGDGLFPVGTSEGEKAGIAKGVGNGWSRPVTPNRGVVMGEFGSLIVVVFEAVGCNS